MNGIYNLTFGVYSAIYAGSEAAYDAYDKACALAELMGDVLVTLIDAETGVVIADNDEED